MAEVAINLKGQDNLSKTIENAKRSVDDLKNSTTELGQCDREFNRIINSGKTLKNQMRQLKELMAQMNMKGLTNTDEFTRIAQAAGEIKDAIADAGDAMTRFSSDTFQLDASIQAIQGVTAAFSVATSTMALFEVENEDVERAILKVQSALTLLNGVQTLANVLNKDSALMQKLKQIRLIANTAATAANTVATTANTASVVGNTAATTANTVALRAWNVTKAIAKALIGDFTGLLIVGAAGLATYALSTSNAKDKQDELNESVKDGADKQKDYYESYNKSISSLLAKYKTLQAQWKALSNDQSRNKWIKDNTAAFNDLGISIRNVNDAEKNFVVKSGEVIRYLKLKAQALAASQHLESLYYERQQLNYDMDKEHERVVNSKDPNDNFGKYNELYQKRNKINQEIKYYLGLLVTINGALSRTNISTPQPQKPQKPQPQKPQKPQNEIEPSEGSLKYWENIVLDLKKQLEYGLYNNEADKERIKQMLDYAEKNIKQKRIELGFEEKSIEENSFDKKSNELHDNLTKLKEDHTEQQFTPTTNNSYGKLEEYYEYIDGQIEANNELINSLKELQQEFANLGDVQGYEDVTEGIDKLNSKNEELTSKRKEIEDFYNVFDKGENAAKNLESVGEVASSVGNLFTQMGNDTAASIAQFAQAQLDAAAKAIPAILQLVMGKEAETLANGQASASSLPFPANIAAMATVTAAVIASFASIISLIGGFAEGGIINGGSTHGDMLVARVNSGEMILNGSQQAKLFDMINDGVTAKQGSTITWKIKGSDLYGTLKNYGNIKSKVGKNIL